MKLMAITVTKSYILKNLMNIYKMLNLNYITQNIVLNTPNKIISHGFLYK